MTEDWRAVLEAGLRELRVPRAMAVADKLLAYAQLILSENKRTNLTGARDLKSVIVDHFFDSLAPLKFVSLVSPVVDVGSGAGFPGVPAAIAYPAAAYVLLEPRAKRAEFLRRVVALLELGNVSVVKSSALGPGAASLIGRAGTVLMRAVARPEAALPIGMPLARAGGTLLIYEGRASRPSAAQQKTASRLGGGSIVVKRVAVPRLEGLRHAWIVRRSR